MIGFNSLGHLGRLGNQMFQFASLKGIARNNNYEYCIPPSLNRNEWTDHQLFNCFKLSKTTSLNIQYIDDRRPIVEEETFEFNENLFNSCPDWVDIRGFFQSEKYFKHISKEIKSDFEFKDEIKIPCLESFQEFENPISLHVRRTDYITNPNHSILPLTYYEKALLEFDSNRQVLIFSDDAEWCLNQKIFDSDRFIVSESKNSYIDMCIMSLCKDHIIANSSFSWWGAWLSDSDRVIAPLDWFGDSNNKHLNTKDIIPEEWEKI